MGKINGSEAKVLKITTCAVIRKGKKFLLARQAKGRHHEGLWAFPGGGTKIGETIEKTVKREVKEETGMEVSVEKFLFSFVLRNDHPEEYEQYPYVGILFYRCKPLTQKIRPNDDVDEFVWVTLKEMKSYKMRPAMYKAIKKLR